MRLPEVTGRPTPRRGIVPVGILALSAGAAGLLAWRALQRSGGRRRLISDASQLARRYRRVEGAREHSLVGRTITINRPRSEVYARWRDFSQFPTFMENVRRIERLDDKRSRWTIAGPAATEIEFVSEIVEDRPNELITWRSVENAGVRNSGRIEFSDAPNGRGTRVAATITYDAPAGEIGRMLAKVFQREPNIQVRRDLKRFKQLLESGEIATSRMRSPPDQTE